MNIKTLTIVAFAALALAACNKGETPAADAAPADTAEAPAEVAPAQSTDTVEAGTGVPECDQYLEKVYACISDKVPEAQRDMMKQGIEQSKDAWKGVADKGELANQCKTAMEQAKASFGAMGCSF
ncbi:hypothetical protein [Stenotrophomonas mori]|uniref:Glutaconyl-CoA decarboxylase subunit gamma n=1 Tax=Stenotrophomonas mori TaxID=2871096 RepID=A0ABT0SGW5_9GAMM|nr:hypothetical protein [Stenotrophomonas mori]MCL7714351.1 hypothetical protein [Stenotrophomonas mori]